MGWSCSVCTFRNVNNSSKSCITCGTARGKLETNNAIDLTTQEENGEKLAAEKKKSGTGTQRTLFGGVVVKEDNNNKATEKSNKKKTDKTTTSNNNDKQSVESSSSALPANNNKNNNNAVATYRPLLSSEPYSVLAQRSRDVMKDVFGIAKLRNQQPKAVECALKGQNQLVVMATGGVRESLGHLFILQLRFFFLQGCFLASK